MRDIPAAATTTSLETNTHAPITTKAKEQEQEQQKQQAQQNNQLHTLTKQNEIAKQNERRLVEYFIILSSIPRQKQKPAEPPPSSSLKDSNGNLTDGNAVNAGVDHNDDYDGLLQKRLLKEEESDENIMQKYFENIDFLPVVSGRYPLEDHEGNELHDSISCFCFPCGSIKATFQNSMPKIHFFVSTGGKGQQIYGTCLTLFESYKISELLSMVETTTDGMDIPAPPIGEKDREVYVPKCLCILSVHQYLAAFREFLTQLHRLSKSNDMPLPMERYIVNFCSEIPAPPPGAFEVQTTILDSTITLWCPPHNQPLAWVSLPFGILFQCLDVENVILIWHALTLERQVLITSTQLSLLTTCSEILLSLLYPMKWSHAYIPVLPHFLVPILSAPMPYLCGIDKYNLPSALFDLSQECIVVDLDVNHVTFGPQTSPLPPLPKYLSTMLHQTLNEQIGMVYREARCLSKNDNYKDRGIYLPTHVKHTSDASWEGTLCLFDEAFHLYFTPEERRKNLLNGSTSDNPTNSSSRFIYLNQREQLKKQQQTKWDIVQEIFFKMYLHLLRSYRKYLIFPTKDAAQEGTYGGAGFVTKSFVSSQRYDTRAFLQQFCSTQMFDFFITKRLYGSGESDVIFFDEAMDRCWRNTVPTGTPLLQSAVVRSKLKTIVPPEPSALDLPVPDMTEGVLVNGAVVSFGKSNDYDDISVVSHGSASTGVNSSSVYSGYSDHHKLDKPSGAADEAHGIGDYVYYYPSLPTAFSVDLIGKPRPLSSAVLAEFDRQREKAAKFRRKSILEQQENGKDLTSFQNTSILKPTAEVATFTVFFMAFTSIVGRELSDMSMKPEEPDRAILSTYVHPVEEIRPLFPTPKNNDKDDPPWYTTKSASSRRFSDLSNSVTIPIVADKSSSKAEDDDDEDDEFKSCGDDIMSRSSLDHVSLDSSSIKHSSIDGSITSTSIAEEHENAARSHPWDNDGSVTNTSITEKQEHAPRSHPWDNDGSVTNTSSTEKQEHAPRSLPSDNSNNVSSITDIEEPSLEQPVSPTKSMQEFGRVSSLTSPEPISDIQSSATNTTPVINNSEPRKRFLNPLHISNVLEAKATAKAQLGLAFEMLTMMRQRQLKADPYTYQCLIDACGRCGDTDRATTLLSRMHEDGIVADGVVYSCLVNAFSSENAWKKLMGNKDEKNLPEWANGNAVEMDWNKLQAKRSYVDVALEKFSLLRTNTSNEAPSSTITTDDDESSVFSSTSFKSQPATQNRRERLKKRLGSFLSRKKEQYGAVPAQESLNPHLTPSNASTHSNNSSSNAIQAKEIIVTEPIMRQILLGENLLGLLYPDISIDADTDTCPRCRSRLTDDDIVKGWKLGDAQDYTTTCPYCTLKFVSHFSVQSTSTSFMGSRGPSSPLVCERLSPWVIQKELRTVMNDSKKEIRNFVDPTWREKETKNAVLWWNLVLSFMRYRLPFTFLMQGSFGNKLITPCPDDEIV